MVTTEDPGVTSPLSIIISGPSGSLSFYPQADHTVYGKGVDNLGAFVATGIYSPRTLQMAFDKRYQSGLEDEGPKSDQTMTIQVA